MVFHKAAVRFETLEVFRRDGKDVQLTFDWTRGASLSAGFDASLIAVVGRSNMRKPRSLPRKPQSQRPAKPGRAIRLSNDLIERIDAWARQQKDNPGRSEAVSQLLNKALRSRPAQTRRSAKKPDRKSSRDRAKDLASDVIDRLGDQDATSETRESRKGRLMKGPEEFRKLRRDRSES
jgi:hypothetical protein